MPPRKAKTRRKRQSKTINDFFKVERTIKKPKSEDLEEEKLLQSAHLCVDNGVSLPQSSAIKNLGEKQQQKIRSKKLTDFYSVRRSSRKPESEIKKEKRQEIEETVLCEEERGLQMCYMLGKGRGVVATKPFVRGDFVVEYRGDLIDLTEAKRREAVYEQDSNVGCYMYYFHHKNQSYCVDATAETGYLGRLVNHSTKEPNLMTRVVEVKNRPHLILVAARHICLGEELLYDYGDRSRHSVEANPWLRST